MRQLALAALITTALLTACGKGEYAGVEPLAASAVAEAAPAEESSAAQLQSSVNSANPADRKLVRQAEVRFRVKDVYQSSVQIENLVAELGGFVTQNHIQARIVNEHDVAQGQGKLSRLTEFYTEGTLEMRVPSEQTQAFLLKLAPLVQFLDERNFSAHDVAIQLLEQQLAQIRSQSSKQSLNENASSSSQVALAKQLIQAEQDAATIQQKLIEDRVAFSTITLNLYQDRQIARSEHDDIKAQLAAAEPSFGSKLQQAFVSGWQGFLDTLIALAHLWPLWLISLFIAAIWRKVKRTKAAKEHDNKRVD
ncbi:DUF4349 domain-containing protein [Chitinibacter sp. SCUT-21]|uniref:DUF4349 domain-containing protein n=1 Tax=Chitinibacter sp. SCUT-21 TaxID=2970891 RepID=UPI0035A58C2C